MSALTFQNRVGVWLLACFGKEIAGDQIERNHRFIEESLELVQACGMPKADAHALVEYVYGRPTGVREQEVGGVMVTLAALCRAWAISMNESAAKELARINVPETMAKVRAKQEAKPRGSALPTFTPNDASDEQIECAAKAIYDHYIFRNPTITPVWVERGNSDKQDTARRFARVALEAANLIERHATHGEGYYDLIPMATHGEGEAVGYVDRTGLEMVRAGTLETLLMHRQKRRVDYAPLYTHPAPSPTAAPALGELAKALTNISDNLQNRHYIDLPNWLDHIIPTLRRAAAALPGVAAQGAGVPKGWTITPQDDAILVRGPGGDAYLSDEKHNSPVSVIVLFRLAKALLAAQGDGKAP